MLKQAENTVRIEGLLSEIDLKYGSFTKNGSPMNSIGGIIKVHVKQEINGTPTDLEVPVHMFASEYTNAGAKNPAYQNIERVMNEFTSIAAADGEAGADAIRITNGRITMNEYYGRDGRFVSFPRITASFVNKIRTDEMKPCATFSASFVVANKTNETSYDGVETGRLKVTGVLPQYGGRVDLVDFIVANPNAINAINQYWNDNDTVIANGRLNFSSKIETVVKEVDFGEAQETTRTISVSELLITGGSQAALEAGAAFDIEEIQAALVERKARLENLKESAEKGKTRTAPTEQKGKLDLGF